MDVCSRQQGEEVFCYTRSWLREKRNSKGVRKEEEQAKKEKKTEMTKRLMVVGDGGNGGALQRTVVDSRSEEDDIIPLLLPQEIRSQQEPRPSTDGRPFQPRCTSTQMNASIYTHTYNTLSYRGLCCCVWEFQYSSCHARLVWTMEYSPPSPLIYTQAHTDICLSIAERTPIDVINAFLSLLRLWP